MISFSTNSTTKLGQARRVFKDGREYLVAPATLIVPGVLPGSKGPLNYSISEIRKNYTDWDYTPLVVYHPTQNGKNVSAKTKGVIERSGIGHVVKTRADKKLTAEAWFDVAHTRRVDNRVLEALESGRPVELSTGLFTDNVPAPAGSVDHRGRPYDYEATNYVPDHIAILPDQIGACSIEDGCGVLVNRLSEWFAVNECSCKGTCSECKINPKKSKAEDPENEDDPEEGDSEGRKLAVNRGYSMTDWVPVDNEWSEAAREAALLARKRRNQGKIDRRQAGLKRYGNYKDMPEGLDPGYWAKAYKLANDERTAGTTDKEHLDDVKEMYDKLKSKDDAEDEMTAAMDAAVDKIHAERKARSEAMAKLREDRAKEREENKTKRDEEKTKRDAEREENKKTRAAEKAKREADRKRREEERANRPHRQGRSDGYRPFVVEKPGPARNQWTIVSNGLVLNQLLGVQMDRNAIINNLVTNCDCWKGSGDREILSRMTDEKLGQLHSAFEREQQAVAVANKAVAGFKAEDGYEYRINPQTAQLEKRMVGNRRAKITNGEMEDEVEDELEDREEEDEVPARNRRRRPRPVQANSGQTAEDWFQNAPVEVQNTFQYARNIEQREKDKIITELLVNVAESERSAHRERLMKRSLPELQNDLAILPKAPKVEERHTQQTFNRSGGSLSRLNDDTLIAPTINWESAESGGASPGKVVVNESNGSTIDDEDWLQNAPPHARQMLINARAIENREKTALIDKITNNISDEDHEKRMRSRLQNKSLEELRDLYLILPRSEKKVQPYFGSAAAPLGNVRVNDVNEDVLPLPTMDWTKAKQA